MHREGWIKKNLGGNTHNVITKAALFGAPLLIDTVLFCRLK